MFIIDLRKDCYVHVVSFKKAVYMDFFWISPTLLKWSDLPLPLALPLSPTNDRLPNIKPFKYHWLFVELMSRYWVLHYRYFIFFINIHVFSIPCFRLCSKQMSPSPTLFNHNRQNQLNCVRLYTCGLICIST